MFPDPTKPIPDMPPPKKGKRILGCDGCDERDAEIERLRAVLKDIAIRGRIITGGDCGVLRDHARRALGLEPLDT